MSKRSVAHATFVIERHFPASVARVFRAWADPAKKQRWFGCHEDWATLEYQLDFREGGSETNIVSTGEGVTHTMKARYFDIVDGVRIVYAYEMFVGRARISASLVTVAFEGNDSRTKMSFTEQVVFFDGQGDVTERHQGTELGIDRLGVLLSAD